MTTDNAGSYYGCLHWVIDPFPEPDEEAASGNCRSRRYGKFFQHSHSRQQKDRYADNHENLIPVVKRKFREWIFHCQRHYGPNILSIDQNRSIIPRNAVIWIGKPKKKPHRGD